jgi:hypothetical protein
MTRPPDVAAIRYVFASLRMCALRLLKPELAGGSLGIRSQTLRATLTNKFAREALPLVGVFVGDTKTRSGSRLTHCSLSSLHFDSRITSHIPFSGIGDDCLSAYRTFAPPDGRESGSFRAKI